MENGVSNVTLDELIKAALTGQRYNQPRLGKQAWLYSQRLSKARAPDLPEDQHQDVFTQAFEELFRSGLAFWPTAAARRPSGARC